MTEVAIEFAHRFCPNCGVPNAKLGSIPFRCAECGFANFFGPCGAVGALVTNEQNQLLLVRRARDPEQGKWGLPGGFVDRSETIEQALAREVFEETRLRISSHDFLMSHPNNYHYGRIIVAVIDIFFVCKVSNAAEITLQASELTEFRYVDKDSSLLEQMAFPSNRIAIDFWINSDSND
ncbi:MutT/NUDIX family protein [Rhodopirellula maiorica SM1]|uniref:MutT/NUDIX family protein n=1 Tax=Rhodopirellula maiorica SM1 TaxID=1265738 RepID=M5RQ84_9BACT|nr:NUDIX domain-containing protein [Rhodopirellula maiorica]EMI21361.1 MutT/NUDIX family protein [Rhodopirellula maiorica SM1]